MQIHKDSEITAQEVEMEGAKNLKMQILIGPNDGSVNIIMRKFTVAPGGHTPHHIHNSEHVVKIISGIGTAIDEKGEPHEVKVGQSLFIAPNEKHQFQNNGGEPFEFLCIILG